MWLGLTGDTSAQCSHSLSSPWPPPTPPGTTRVGVGFGEQLQPDPQDAPTPPRAGFGHGFACEGSPRASPRPLHRARPAQLCSASSRHLHGSLRTALLLLSLQTPTSLLALCLTRVVLTETGWLEINQAEMSLERQTQPGTQLCAYRRQPHII